MDILPQTTQNNELIFLLDENLAITENGSILFYDFLGQLHNTNYECILDEINADTSKERIQKSIVDLKNLEISEFVVDLINNTIDLQPFKLINDDTFEFEGFKVNIETLEIASYPISLENNDYVSLDTLEVPQLTPKIQDNIRAIVWAFYRKGIENFVNFETLRKESLEFCD